MKLYPYEKVNISTDLTPEEISTRLRSYVEKVNYPAYDLYAPDSKSTLFGLVDEGGFEIYRTRFFNNRPITIVYGDIRENKDNQRREVEMVYKLTFFTKLFFFLWHTFCFTYLTILLYHLPAIDKWEILFPVLMLIAGNRFILIPFQVDINYFNQFFARTLKDAPQSQELHPSGIV